MKERSVTNRNPDLFARVNGARTGQSGGGILAIFQRKQATREKVLQIASQFLSINHLRHHIHQSVYNLLKSNYTTDRSFDATQVERTLDYSLLNTSLIEKTYTLLTMHGELLMRVMGAHVMYKISDINLELLLKQSKDKQAGQCFTELMGIQELLLEVHASVDTIQLEFMVKTLVFAVIGTKRNSSEDPLKMAIACTVYVALVLYLGSLLPSRINYDRSCDLQHEVKNTVMAGEQVYKALSRQYLQDPQNIYRTNAAARKEKLDKDRYEVRVKYLQDTGQWQHIPTYDAFIAQETAKEKHRQEFKQSLPQFPGFRTQHPQPTPLTTHAQQNMQFNGSVKEYVNKLPAFPSLEQRLLHQRPMSGGRCRDTSVKRDSKPSRSILTKVARRPITTAAKTKVAKTTSKRKTSRSRR
jgi:hypothetical protein